MRLVWLAFLVVVISTLLVGCGGPSQQQIGKDRASGRTVAAIQDMPPICPVTGHEIEDQKTAPTSVYEGKRYYFQCPSCKAEFDRDPDKYVANYAEKLEQSKKETRESEKADEADEARESESSH